MKSMKSHLKRVVGSIKLTFEELTTVLAQVESCLTVDLWYLNALTMMMGLKPWLLDIS